MNSCVTELYKVAEDELDSHFHLCLHNKIQQIIMINFQRGLKDKIDFNLHFVCFPFARRCLLSKIFSTHRRSRIFC